MKAIIALTALVSGLLSGGYALQAKSSRGYIDSKCERSQVLILGAGMAGVSAGKTLVENGIHDFKIIEYQHRVGGRTLHTGFGTKPDGSAWTVELGTNWITGLHSRNGSSPSQGPVNPIWTLAEQVNLTTASDAVQTLFYNQNGLHDWSGVLDRFSEADDRMARLGNQRIKEGKQDFSARVGLDLVSWDSTNDMIKQAAEWYIWDADGATSVELSSALFAVISDDATEGKWLGQFSRFVVDQRGYDVVIKHLASEYLGMNDSRLLLSNPVTKIKYSDQGVVAYTANDTCFEGDYAICTFSLGVLQQAINHRAPVSFEPAFPEWKAESIFGNIMGIYTKIFYQFDPDDVWWPKDVQYFLYASPTTRGYWPYWESLDFPRSPLHGSGIIFATMVWDQSKRIEQQSDEATMQEGLEVLRQMFPNVTIPQPKAFFYPRWGMTPWSFGSYSNWATGYTLEQHTNFRANLARLWFAGEATSSEYWGYLQGAFYEGKLAGQEVAACAKGGDACAERKRYSSLAGSPESWFNETSGFQNPIKKLVDHEL